MDTKKINIINACTDLGVNIDGASKGPIIIKEYIKKLDSKKINKIIDVTCDCVNKSQDKNDLRKNFDRINKFDDELYQAILKNSDNDSINIVIGGDHSIAIASALASIKTNDRLGIIWVDTHPDFNTFKTTISGNIHGLPLATVTENNGYELTEFHDGNFFRNNNTVIIGARDIDALEQVNLDNSKIKVYSTNDVISGNIEAIVNNAIQIATQSTNGIHLSIDVDVLDPIIAPGISVGYKDGINTKHLFKIVDEFLKHKDLIKSIDIVEYNPINDKDNKTLKIVLELINEIVNML